MEPQTKRRKENWSKGEVSALTSGYLDVRATIDGRLSQSLRATDKDMAWRSILDSVNAQENCLRSVDEAKKKLSDIKTNVKKRESERCKLANLTGGGEAPHLEMWEDKMIEAIGDAAEFGLGVDTFQANMSNETVSKATCLASYEPAPSSSTSESSVQNYSFEPVPSTSTSKQKTDENFEEKSKKNDKVKDEKSEVIRLLTEILNEQKMTNAILSQLYSIPDEQ